jgi:heme exporter protein C
VIIPGRAFASRDSARRDPIAAILGWLALAGLLAVGVLVFGFTPDDASMGFSQKIMYVHVPAIWAAYVAFFIVFFCSIGYLWKRAEALDRMARSGAEVGVVFCGLALASGSIWGRPTWGTYWIWDARLTTTLLLFLVYVGYGLLRRFAGAGEQAARLAAVIGIVGFLDIPLIHVSVDWWRTLHQPSTLFKAAGGAPKPAMPIELLLPLLLGGVAMLMLLAWLLLARLRLAELTDRLERRVAEN